MQEYDVVIVGAGIAGLSAATYASADGMKVALVERAGNAGGQAWHSPKIDNVIGMEGISGYKLAERALDQASRFGTDYIEEDVRSITWEAEPELRFDVRVASGFTLRAKAVVLATGCYFQKLAVPWLVVWENKVLFYGQAWRHDEDFVARPVAVVGGGNAAAQSALHLAQRCSYVNVLVRHDPVWSSYLRQEIEQHPRIMVHSQTELIGIADTWAGRNITTIKNGETKTLKADGVFVLAGQRPNLFLADQLRLRQNLGNGDRIMTGGKFVDWPDDVQRTGISRDPLSMETSIPGVFAIGDVRDGIGHGIAAAMGDGNVVVNDLWVYLKIHHRATFQALLTGAQRSSLRPRPVSRASDVTPIQSPQT